MSAPYDSSGLWNKARLFINRSFDCLDRDEFDQAALWASLSLELLGKALLSSINPLLIADPVDDGKSLFIAAGVNSEHNTFRSIAAKTVFARCQRLFPAFDRSAALLISQSRNEDLHSASLPFAAVPQDIWWQRFWALASILIAGQERDVESFVGIGRLAGVEDVLEKVKANVAERARTLVEKARHRSSMLQEPAQRDRARKELAQIVARQWSSEYSVAQECPACANPGFLGAEDGQRGPVRWDDDSAWQEISCYADQFSCSSCGLYLEDSAHLEAVGLAADFQTDVEPELDRYAEYGND